MRGFRRLIIHEERKKRFCVHIRLSSNAHDLEFRSFVESFCDNVDDSAGLLVILYSVAEEEEPKTFKQANKKERVIKDVDLFKNERTE